MIEPKPAHCDFCPWPPTTKLLRMRRALLDVVLRRPAPAVYVCDNHLSRGLDYVRSWRWREVRRGR